MRVIYLFCGRFPSEKAAALFTGSAMESFAAVGIESVIVASRRRYVGNEAQMPMPRNVRVVYIPTLDLYGIPILERMAHYVAITTYSLSVWWFLFRHGLGDDVIFSNELVPLTAASLVSSNTVYELHDFPRTTSVLTQHLLPRMWRILSTNAWKAKALHEQFGIPEERIFVEPNGVDVAQFDIPETRAEARAKLSITTDVPMALYTGHLYGWKGVDTLALASKLMPEIQVYVVGGTPKDVTAFKEKYAGISNLNIMGLRPHSEIPLWQRAADVLVLPNTASEDISAKYTSPMKLFEYMASGTPVVASRLESIEFIASDKEVTFVQPDDPAALADSIKSTIGSEQGAEIAHAARVRVAGHAWKVRAERISAALGHKA